VRAQAMLLVLENRVKSEEEDENDDEDEPPV
jgi:hypothetical protein